jgi:predicted DNA-binding WGR domain protein
MKMCELEKSGETGTWRLYQTAARLSETNADGSGKSWSAADPEAADAEFDAAVAARRKKGWKETDRSLSRRVFLFGEDPPAKCWIIWLKGNAMVVQFGKVSKQLYLWSDDSGQTKIKEFPTREKALQEYGRMISRKHAEGYREVHPRKTEYSNLGHQE